MAKKNRYGTIIKCEESSPTTICLYCKYNDADVNLMPCRDCHRLLDTDECYQKDEPTKTK